MLLPRFASSSKLLSLTFLGCAVGLTSCTLSTRSGLQFVSASESLVQNKISLVEESSWPEASDMVDQPLLEVHRLEHSEIYLLRLPASVPFTIEPVASSSLETLPDFVQQQGGQAGNVIAAINGGFFDPKNQQTASHVIRDGEVLLDPNQNLDLMSNRNVSSYMSQILNRSEFRRYRCTVAWNGVPKIRYGIDFHHGLVPSSCERLDALGAGPQLLPRMTHQEEAFWDVVDGKTVRNPIGLNGRNARSAIAITSDGGLLLAMAAQLPPEPPVQNPSPEDTSTDQPDKIAVVKPPVRTGVTLTEMADFLREQGGVQALNLDGGSSSSLFYKQQIYYGRLDRSGQPVQRSIKSALVVRMP